MATSDVGSRELKTRLGTYLQRVREGQTFIVTDRGEPIAELRPLGRSASSASTADRLNKLAAKGVVTRPRTKTLSVFKPARLRKGASAARAISEGREDRF
jgi:prevent-host-death family protein